MTQQEHQEFRKLPDEVRVFRGFIGERGKGMSWTTDRDKAEWFARRFVLLEELGDPKIMLGVVRKTNVLAYFSRRKESEVVVDPTKVNKQKVQMLDPEEDP